MQPTRIEFINLKKAVLDEVVTKMIPEDVLSKVSISGLPGDRLMNFFAVHVACHGWSGGALADAQSLHDPACICKLHDIRCLHHQQAASALPRLSNHWSDLHV